MSDTTRRNAVKTFREEGEHNRGNEEKKKQRNDGQPDAKEENALDATWMKDLDLLGGDWVGREFGVRRRRTEGLETRP